MGENVVTVIGPLSHISTLASLHKSFCIQMVDPWDLFHAVDCSTDLREDLGYTMDEHFGELLDQKYENCTEWYLTNLATLGVQEPLVVIVRSDDGKWQFDEGHHRLSWALRNRIPLVPVIFDDSGADDESHAGFMVSRANVEAYHTTVTEEFLVPPATYKLLDEPEESVAAAEYEHDQALAAKKLKNGDYIFEQIRREERKSGPGGRHRAK